MGESTWWGRLHERVACGHCGRQWTRPAEEPPAGEIAAHAPVLYQVLRCPACGSEATKVTSTRRPIRYHKCLTCGGPFKSVEQGGGDFS